MTQALAMDTGATAIQRFLLRAAPGRHRAGVDFAGWQGKVEPPKTKPPCSNTGVQITNTRESIANPAVVDWVSFTLPVGKDGDTLAVTGLVRRWLGDEGDSFDCGKLGYSKGYKVLGTGLVLHRPDRPDMGVHCILPSGALEFLHCSIEELITWVFDRGGSFRRIDIAVDTHDVPIDVVADAVERRDVISRCQRAREEKEFWQPGRTVYVGRRVSERFARLYDKQAEQGLPAEVDGKPAIWTRCEIEFKKSQAMAVATHILRGVNLRDLIFSAIDFRDRTEDSNASRCERLPWWDKWIGACERVSFVVKTFEEVADDIRVEAEKVWSWVTKQVGPSLAFLYEASGGNPVWMDDLCTDNIKRIPSARLRRLRRAEELKAAWLEAEAAGIEAAGAPV